MDEENKVPEEEQEEQTEDSSASPGEDVDKKDSAL